MTPQELLRIARNINPQKLETDPQAALEDAYVVAEALRLAELEKVSVPNYKAPAKRKAARTGKVDTVAQLQAYLKSHPKTSTAAVSRKLKISGSQIYNYFSGKYRPSADTVAKIEAFLTDAGHYE